MGELAELGNAPVLKTGDGLNRQEFESSTPRHFAPVVCWCEHDCCFFDVFYDCDICECHEVGYTPWGFWDD